MHRSSRSHRNDSRSSVAFVPVDRIARRVDRDDRATREAEWIARGEARRARGDVLDTPPALVQARIRRTALVPAIITVPCPDHDAAVGEYCYRHAHGVCAERIKARAAQR